MEPVLKKAAAHLALHDAVLAPIIASAPLPSFIPHTDYYQALVDSIVGQQLSVKAAATIRKRFVDLFDGTFPSPKQILASSIDQLRTAGLSRSKAAYIQDLARHTEDGTVQFTTIDALSNDEIIKELTAVKGIGEWTVHMFLMFCMGRMDVLPTGDLGIRNGIKRLYKLEDMPTPEDIATIALKNQWYPYESVASWYIWHSLDNAPKI